MNERQRAFNDFIEAVEAMIAEARHDRNVAHAKGDRDAEIMFSADARVMWRVIDKCKALRGPVETG